MSKYKVGFIGTGNAAVKPSAEGYAMAYRHARGYRRRADLCDIVACADIVEANARAFAKEYGFERIYSDYREMLAKEKLDIVSICTWPALHAEMTVACCEAGVKAVHCEKPMALTWGDSRRMARVAEERGVQLTFNHQRRFGRPMRTTRDLVKAGEIGELVRMEACAINFYDTGTHWFDLMNMFNGEAPAEWVIGQIDCREDIAYFGARVESQGICHTQYRNGVTSVFFSGAHLSDLAPPFRLLGTKGVIEIGKSPDPGPMLRYRNDDMKGWQELDCEGDTLHGPDYTERAMADIVDALAGGREPELSARRALNATEIIFACYESSRRRARIDLPLTIDDNPLIAMVEAGQVGAGS